MVENIAKTAYDIAEAAKQDVPRFYVVKSCHGMPSVEFHNPSEELRLFIYRVMRSCYMDDPAYKVRQACGAFLQSDCHDLMMVEFWQRKGIDEFIAYLNKHAPR